MKKKTQMDQLREWKEEWDHGHTKFIPELFEMTRRLLLKEELEVILKELEEQAANAEELGWIERERKNC